jgi:DnaJ-class molecular chaperone|tara:strand:+ start:355 stop:558 length:204 start_codon:yes stop_codon:yes gene_type:complete
MSKIGNYVVGLQEAEVDCPECEGNGMVEVEFAVPHNCNRDIGYLDTRMEECENCYGSGQVEKEEDDE